MLAEGTVKQLIEECYGRTHMDLTNALAHSNNYYFANLGVQRGYERMNYYAHLFGYGEKAGLNIPGTIDHVLQIVRRWSVDMGVLRSALTDLAEKPTLLIWGDRDRTVGLTSGRQLQRILSQSVVVGSVAKKRQIISTSARWFPWC